MSPVFKLSKLCGGSSGWDLYFTNKKSAIKYAKDHCDIYTPRLTTLHKIVQINNSSAMLNFVFILT